MKAKEELTLSKDRQKAPIALKHHTGSPYEAGRFDLVAELTVLGVACRMHKSNKSHLLCL